MSGAKLARGELVTSDFMCRLDRDTGCLETWSNTIPGVPARVSLADGTWTLTD